MFSLSACRSISRSNTELALPPAVVFFCFDDGPNAHGDTTARLLDILKKYEIHAMFVLLGENAEVYPKLVRRIYDEGHLIINHGYSDRVAIGMNEVTFKNNLALGEAAISAALEKEMYPKLYQPHGGFYRSRQEKILREADYTMVAVNIRVYDAVTTGAEKDRIVRQVIKKVEKQNGGIILLHDGRDSHHRMKRRLERNPSSAFDRSWIPSAVEEIIIALKSRGFILDSPIFLPDLFIR
jgi:peptidoglycan/xylan/chitin deacetylase (PgdA/CDA1 family)